MIEQFLRERFFNPWHSLAQLHPDAGALWHEQRFGDQGLPALDVYEGAEKVMVQLEVPGVKTQDIDITAQDNTLVIKGERKLSEQKDDVTFLRQERQAGSFSRTITLPFRIDSERIKAKYAQGILQVEIERPEEVKPKKINIKVN